MQGCVSEGSQTETRGGPGRVSRVLSCGGPADLAGDECVGSLKLVFAASAQVSPGCGVCGRIGPVSGHPENGHRDAGHPAAQMRPCLEPLGPRGQVCSCPACMPVSPADWTVLGLGLAPKQGWWEGHARWALAGLPASSP